MHLKSRVLIILVVMVAAINACTPMEEEVSCEETTEDCTLYVIEGKMYCVHNIAPVRSMSRLTVKNTPRNLIIDMTNLQAIRTVFFNEETSDACSFISVPHCIDVWVGNNKLARPCCPTATANPTSISSTTIVVSSDVSSTTLVPVSSLADVSSTAIAVSPTTIDPSPVSSIAIAVNPIKVAVSPATIESDFSPINVAVSSITVTVSSTATIVDSTTSNTTFLSTTIPLAVIAAAGIIVITLILILNRGQLRRIRAFGVHAEFSPESTFIPLSDLSQTPVSPLRRSFSESTLSTPSRPSLPSITPTGTYQHRYPTRLAMSRRQNP